MNANFVQRLLWLKYVLLMMRPITILILIFTSAPLHAQNIGTILFSDSLLDNCLGKEIQDFKNLFKVEPIKSDSIKKIHHPFNVYAYFNTTIPLYVAKQFQVLESLICESKNGKVSAIIFYVQGEGGSVFKIVRNRYGRAQSEINLNAGIHFGIDDSQMKYLWRVDNYLIHFTRNNASNVQVIAVSVADVNDYMKTRFDK